VCSFTDLPAPISQLFWPREVLRLLASTLPIDVNELDTRLSMPESFLVILILDFAKNLCHFSVELDEESNKKVANDSEG
jgi:hypothetical protein